MNKSHKIIWGVFTTGVAEVIILFLAAFVALVISGVLKLDGWEHVSFWFIVFIAIILKFIGQQLVRKF